MDIYTTHDFCDDLTNQGEKQKCPAQQAPSRGSWRVDMLKSRTILVLSTSREKVQTLAEAPTKVAKSFGSFGTKPGRFCILCVSVYRLSPLLGDVLNEQPRDVSPAPTCRGGAPQSQRLCLRSRSSGLFRGKGNNSRPSSSRGKM